MSKVDPNLISDLQARGLVAQMTGAGELEALLNSEPQTLYCGFDPTARSLHIGSLVPLLVLKRFQMAGHRPIALVGGATGLIGDPSFKAQERALNSNEVVAEWVECLKRQVSAFVEFDGVENAALVVNNLDWTQGMDVLSFLRDVGKHFSINNMVNKESVKQRIDRAGEGISYTEFSYMILQSLDFAELYKRHGCTLQVGGSDQWGNITGGVELVRRLHGGSAFGLTLPLVTKADGTKFGKTESGTIWLDPDLTSPYAFYQFWINTADADAYKFLSYFTFLPMSEIKGIEEGDRLGGGKPQAQSILAEQVTRLVHGDNGLSAARRITQALFDSKVSELTESDLEQLGLDGLPSTVIGTGGLKGKTLSQLLVEWGVVNSGKQVKDALGREAVLINEEAKGEADNLSPEESFVIKKAFFGRFFVVRVGKKKYHLLELK